jgi:hypothetical protein
MEVASIREIRHFLAEVKRIIAIDPNKFVLIPRRKNIEAIARLGVIPRDEVMSLTYKDYDRGPLPDNIGDGSSVWEFVKNIDDVMVYIKLKIDARGCICISFHEANEAGPFSLPYK